MFVVLFMARSGSKFLRSLLNQHPDVNDFGEVFHNRGGAFNENRTLLNVFSEVAMSPYKVPGFQFRYPRHPSEFPEIDTIIKNRSEEGSLKIILLKRKNKLKAAISQQNSERLKRETGKAHLFKSSLAHFGKLELDVKRACKEALDRSSKDKEYVSWAESKRLRFIEVFYEDICDNAELEVNKIFSFLGVSKLKPGTLKDSDLVKVTSDNLSESLKNYQELEEALFELGRLDWIYDGVSETQLPVNSADTKVSVQDKVLVKKLDVKAGGTLYDFSFEINEDKRINIKIDAPRVKTNCKFLEHVLDGDYIVCSQPDLIKLSYDGGSTWVDNEVSSQYMKCFTLSNGIHLLQTDSGSVHRYDSEWKFLGEVEGGSYPWHGTWSIDENPSTGTVVWGEYPYAASEVALWRSENSGALWKKVLSVKGDPDDPKGGDIRHFHLVQKCSTVKDRWYASSGDTENQSKFWVSEDDGISWTLIPIYSVHGQGASDIPESLKGRLYRFTGMIQTSDELIWATDDTFKGLGSKLCVVKKDRLGEVLVAENHLGMNEVRNFIKLDDKLALAVSESKLDVGNATLTLVDLEDLSILSRKLLPNDLLNKANFMNGLSSKAACNGRFFCQNDNVVIRPSSMTLRFSLSYR
ncbi:sulfotransferase domain-containing protein [Cobetia sp. AM6]|uniref:sulfotransferase domain-containing protein n=1 Tax=Cobetia sp. AM6 TaxID=2661553 RepID=UPI00129920FD|nr:sulfotransferase domain-containing protein [Cobetia sp. AM6]BBO56826.1 hypothetical protein CLAM6_21370 [Cobetia sp. AM6]